MSVNIEDFEKIERAASPELDAILGYPFPVLDHGFLRVVDYMGTEASIVQAARVSYGKGTKTVNEDVGLLRYLIAHHHNTPLEQPVLRVHVKLPIFVARQWIRHRTGAFNEYSGRYSVMDSDFYVPKPEHLSAQSKSNKQGRGDVLEGDEAARVLHLLQQDASTAYEHYEEMLNVDKEGNPLNPDKQGLARELARMNLPVSFYTQWYWKVDLHNLLNFLRLRQDHHAQYEIRAYADVLANIVQQWVPNVWQAHLDYRINSITLSPQEQQANAKLRGLSWLDDAGIVANVKSNFGMSSRAAAEFLVKFRKLNGD